MGRQFERVEEANYTPYHTLTYQLLNVVSTSVERLDVKEALFVRQNDIVCRLGCDDYFIVILRNRKETISET